MRAGVALTVAVLLAVVGLGTVPAAAWEVEATPGVVTVPDGFSPDGVTVTVQGYDDSYDVWVRLETLTPAADGAFEIPALADYVEFRAVFTGTGLRWQSQPVTGEPLAVTMVAGGGTVSGTITTPFPWSFDVRVRGVSGEAEGDVREVYAAQGAYSFSGLAPGATSSTSRATWSSPTCTGPMH